MYTLHKHKSELHNIYSREKKGKEKEKPHSSSFVCSGQWPRLTPNCRSDLCWPENTEAIRRIESRPFKKSFKIIEKHIWLKSIKVTESGTRKLGSLRFKAPCKGTFNRNGRNQNSDTRAKLATLPILIRARFSMRANEVLEFSLTSHRHNGQLWPDLALGCRGTPFLLDLRASRARIPLCGCKAKLSWHC